MDADDITKGYDVFVMVFYVNSTYQNDVSKTVASWMGINWQPFWMAVKGPRLQAVDPEDDENVAVDPEAMDQLAKKPVVLRPVGCRFYQFAF